MREADDLDSAAELTQQRTDDAVREARFQARPQQVVNPDGSWPQPDCDDCGNEIPAGRLALGKIRCVYCQSRRERGVRL